MARIRLQIAKGDKDKPVIVFRVEDMSRSEDILISRYYEQESRKNGDRITYYEYIPETDEAFGFYKLGFANADDAEAFCEYLVENDINTDTPRIGFNVKMAIQRFHEISARAL